MKERDEEKVMTGRKGRGGWGDAMVWAETGNVHRKYFQSIVICFLYKPCGLHERERECARTEACINHTDDLQTKLMIPAILKSAGYAMYVMFPQT